MKVLLINNHHKIIGGAEKHYLLLGKLLTQNGNKVAYFSTKSSGTQKTNWQKYFLKGLDFKNAGLQNFWGLVKRVIYSLEAKKKISKLLDDFKPDIVHIHNIYYHISPSILPEIKKRKIPVIQTVHDYQLISPNVTLFSNGKISEVTKKHKYYMAILRKTVDGNFAASLIAAVNSYFQYILKIYIKNVDLFIFPSRFVQRKFREYGFEPQKIAILPNFTPIPAGVHEQLKKNYYLYYGRINIQKGAFLLLEAARKVPDIQIKVAGRFDSPFIKNEFFKIIKGVNNVEYMGFLEGKRLERAISKSYAVIVPSLWYENSPLSIIEPFSMGRTVIASKTGGIPELVRDNFNGLLFKPGSTRDLANKISKMWLDKKLNRRLALNAAQHARANYSPQKYYTNIIKIYKEMLGA